MTQTYSHYSKVPASAWHWPNFSPREIASKREGEIRIDTDAMNKLQKLRERLGVPMVITSAYRSAAHNRAVGGASASQHLYGKAFDVVMANHDPAAFEQAARAVGFTGFGYYPKQGFMHIDTGPSRVWGDPFPRTATRTAPQPVIPQTGVTSPDGAAAAGAGVAGGLVIGWEHLPAAGSFLGALEPVGQAVAVVAAVGLLAYIIWRRR